jgi:hypothetical protein
MKRRTVQPEKIQKYENDGPYNEKKSKNMKWRTVQREKIRKRREGVLNNEKKFENARKPPVQPEEITKCERGARYNERISKIAQNGRPPGPPPLETRVRRSTATPTPAGS